AAGEVGILAHGAPAEAEVESEVPAPAAQGRQQRRIEREAVPEAGAAERVVVAAGKADRDHEADAEVEIGAPEIPRHLGYQANVADAGRGLEARAAERGGIASPVGVDGEGDGELEDVAEADRAHEVEREPVLEHVAGDVGGPVAIDDGVVAVVQEEAEAEAEVLRHQRPLDGEPAG